MGGDASGMIWGKSEREGLQDLVGVRFGDSCTDKKPGSGRAEYAIRFLLGAARMDKIINEDISYSLDVCRGGMRSCEAGRKEENLREV